MFEYSEFDIFLTTVVNKFHCYWPILGIMANAKIESIVRDTKDLMLQINGGEKRIDEMIRRVNTVNEKISCIRDYRHCMSAINPYTVNGSRRAVLLEELQRENRQILAFHEENRNLREAIDESMETLAIVMTRHRNVITRIDRMSKRPLPRDAAKLFIENCDDNGAKDKERFRRLICDLSDLMKQCEDVSTNDLQVLSQLLYENDILREVLSSAVVTTPGVKQAFSNALAELKIKNEPSSTNVVLADAEVNTGISEKFNEAVSLVS
ncbi:hypothetical protein DICVIV_07529 [Dictyocaulus viviparus]|uniref:Uncharacterized protein n=1 Tax=Dictyocaulus viviparus TaxID=29172 RepID=A0A0D8XVM4_DICVI|nr:hypothetical protein DICVIV_07529 [Dictyocaulus viviparus]